jgi:restriction endonuclease
MLDHESALNVNNYAAGYIEPLNSSLSNSALLRNLMKTTQNLSQHSGKAMMQSTQQDHSTRSQFLASKRIDFSAPTT